MPNQDYLTINGTQINLVTYQCAIDRCTPYVRGGIPELGFSRILGKLTALPDPWSCQPCSWSNGSSYPGTTYFSGDVVGYSDRYEEGVGWIREYRALGLRNRADWIPVTDSNTFSDVAAFNMPSNNLYTVASRQGRTVGQCVLDLLSMYQNVTALTAVGVGNFTSAGSGGAATSNLGGTRGWTVTSLTLVSGGSGYTTAPTVVISGPCTTQAVYTANVSGGAITGFNQITAGAGYLSPPTVIISTLPSTTVSDLGALNVIPPFRVSFAGERIIQSIETAIQTCHPNHWLHIDPSGTIRILDQRSFTGNTVTLGQDPGSAESDGTYGNRWLMPFLHRDTSDCYSQVVVRGGEQTGARTLAVKQWPGSSYTFNGGTLTGGAIASGGLIEDFAYGSYTSNAAAKAAWTPSMYQQLSLQTGQDQGSCTCGSTTSITITSETSQTYAADQLDQTDTGQHAQITVFSDTVSGLQQMFTSRVIANAATSGGTTVLTIDNPLPSTAYNSYRLYALSSGGNVVWRRYKVTNPEVAAAMQQYFPYPFAFTNSDGTAAALTQAPVCSVLWSPSGSAPYNQSTVGVTIDPVAGTITTDVPTSLVYGGGVVTPPSDVQVFIPVAVDALTVQYPVSGYGGTLYTVEGLQRTKTVTVREWTDYSLNANMAAFAQELFGSLCDVIVEGTISYLGLPTHYLAPGQAISIAGTSGSTPYTTGYESIALPVASLDIQFNPGPGGTTYVSTLHLSNRRQRYTSDVFVRPAATGHWFGDSGQSLATFGEAADRTSAVMSGTDFSGGVAGASADSPEGGPFDNVGSIDPNTHHTKKHPGLQQGPTEATPSPSEGPPAEGSPMSIAGPLDGLFDDSADQAEVQRRLRAGSHGSLREARNINPPIVVD